MHFNDCIQYTYPYRGGFIQQIHRTITQYHRRTCCYLIVYAYRIILYRQIDRQISENSYRSGLTHLLVYYRYVQYVPSVTILIFHVKKVTTKRQCWKFLHAFFLKYSQSSAMPDLMFRSSTVAYILIREPLQRPPLTSEKLV